MRSDTHPKGILTETECFEALDSVGQLKLLHHWKQLTPQEQESLRRQISHIDFQLFQQQREAVLRNRTALSPLIDPFTSYEKEPHSDDFAVGQRLVEEGRAAVLMLAGGQGSRLRFSGPKGCYPITPFKKKSLFQYLCEKVKAAGRLTQRSLEIGIMTSPLNHVETQTFFEEHAFFGLHPSQFSFFYQKMWPLLDFEGNLFLESPSRIASGPNGNGEVFQRLIEVGLWEKWKKRGVEMVNVFPVDNPLSNPFDFELFGFFSRNRCDAAAKVSLRIREDEPVGLLAMQQGRPLIMEYSEMPLSAQRARNAAGGLKFDLANLGLFCFSLSLIEYASKQKFPLHCAKKTVKKMSDKGGVDFPTQPNAWKCEKFIFDVLPFTTSFKALLSPRTFCFAPLKNLSGEDSIEEVQAAMLASDRAVFKKLTGCEPPHGVRFELAPDFYYPTPELKKRWWGEPLPNKDYIHD